MIRNRLLSCVVWNRKIPLSLRQHSGCQRQNLSTCRLFSIAIRYCFLNELSANPRIHDQARNFLQLCSFKPKESSPVTNGTALFLPSATILWGNHFVPTSDPSPNSSP